MPMIEQGSLPNIQRLLDDDGTILHLEPISGTGTVGNWATAWTGLTYNVTGLGGNHKYDEKAKFSKLTHLSIWVRQLPWELTILNNLRKKGIKVGWFVAKKFVGGELSPFLDILANADASQYFPHNEDYILAQADTAKQFITDNAQSDYIMFILTNPDHYGHKFGEASDRYRQEFVRSDSLLGSLMDYVQDDPDVKFCVISDHGFDKGMKTHFNAPDNAFITNLPIDSKWIDGGATMRDFANTIIDYWKIPVPGNTRRYGKSLLKKHSQHASNLTPGWNLLGLGSNNGQPLDVTALGAVISVWKWTTINGKKTCAVYLPGEVNPGSYAAAKGFAQFTTIEPSEGFWVNKP
jgi:predicted AlkP superfamily pyrophosphatase or phosphodiesterase